MLLDAQDVMWVFRRNPAIKDSMAALGRTTSSGTRPCWPPWWMREVKAPELNDGEKGFVWQTRRTMVEALAEAEVLAYETGRIAPGHEMHAELEGCPVIVRNRVGKGEAVYIVDDLSQGYYQAPFRSIKAILRNLIAEAQAPFRVEAPSQILANAFWQDEHRRLVIHLLNLPPMSTRLFERSQLDTLDDIVPVHDITVTLQLNSAVKSVRLEPAGIELPRADLSDGRQRITVPTVAEHEMVVVQLDR